MRVDLPVLRRPRNSDRFGVLIVCRVADILRRQILYAAVIMLHPRRNPTTVIIDSRDRIGSSVNYDTFSVLISPAISDATGVRLLFASIGVPLLSTEPFYMIRCAQLGISVRAAAGGTGCTFVVPVSSQPGYRSLHGAENEFSHKVTLQQPAEEFSRLDFQVLVRGGGPAGLTEDLYMILEISYD